MKLVRNTCSVSQQLWYFRRFPASEMEQVWCGQRCQIKHSTARMAEMQRPCLRSLSHRIWKCIWMLQASTMSRACYRPRIINSFSSLFFLNGLNISGHVVLILFGVLLRTSQIFLFEPTPSFLFTLVLMYKHKDLSSGTRHPCKKSQVLLCMPAVLLLGRQRQSDHQSSLASS